MGTNYIAPIWRMPENVNKDKLSNYSIDFDTTDHVNLSGTWVTDLGLSGATKASISVWFKPNSTSEMDVIDSWYSGSTNKNLTIKINLGATGNVIVYNGTNNTYYTPENVITTGQWNHVVIVWDASEPTAATKTKAYVNGSLVTNTSNTSFTSIIDKGRSFNISGYVKEFDGEISQVCIFDYALSSDQINYLYNLNNPMVITGGEPVAYLPLGDNSNPNADAGYPNISVGADSVFDFNTSGAWIDCGNNPALNVGTGDLSISAWVYPTSDAGNDDVCCIGANGGTRFRLQRRADRIGAYIDSAAGQSAMDGSTPLSTNQWYHFVLIKAGVNFNLYLNGNEVSEASYINSGSFTDTEVAIGQYFGGFGNRWAGELSNIQIWNSALTTTSPNSDLKTLYNNGQPLMSGTQPQENNLQAWYKLNQSANWEADITGSWQIPDAVSLYPQSFKFNENQDYIQGDLNLASDKVHAVSFWVKNKQVSGLGYVVTNRVSSYGPGFSFIINQSGSNNGYIFSNVKTSPTTTQSVATNYISQLRIPNDDQWHHVAWTQDTVTYKLKAYIDGVFVYEQLPTARTDSNNIADLKISSDVSTQDFGGYVSNVMVWEDVVLTDGGVALNDVALGEIAQVYNNGVPISSASVQSDKLKGWYKLDNTETYLKPGASQTQNLYEAWLVENQKYPASVDKCLLFANQNAITYDNFNLINEPELTVSFWYLHDQSVNSYDRVLGSRDNTAYNFYVNVGRSGAANMNGLLRTNDGAGGFINHNFYFGNISTPTVGWRLLTMTYNGSVIKAYLNNEEVDSVSATGTVYDLNPYIGGSRNYNQSIRDGNGSANGMRMSNVIYWNKALTPSELTTLYNNGTPLLTKESIPQDSSMLLWNTLENKIETIGGGLYDKSGNSVSIQTITNPSTIIVDNVPVSAESGLSSGMTEQNLVDNNVSALNGESSGMTTANLVTSNLTRTQPYSNYSFNFDGSSEVIDITNNSIFNLGSSFSISGWFNLDYSNSTKGLISFDSSTTRGWFFYTLSGNEIRIFDGTNAFVLKTSYTTTGQWDNFIVTYDGSNLVFYINGVQESTQAVSVNLQTNGNNGQIGNNQFASGRFFDGKMSNIALLDRALTEQEVLKIYNNGVPQDLQTTSTFSNNIVAWWAMDERSSYYDGTDWVVRDLINGNDGGGINTGGVEDLVGNAPGSEGSGTGTNLTIADLKGNMYNSKNNAYSINMADYADGVTNPANSGRSTEVPSV